MNRGNEEQDFKGSDLTHNKKETKEKHLKEKKGWPVRKGWPVDRLTIAH